MQHGKMLMIENLELCTHETLVTFLDLDQFPHNFLAYSGA